MKLPKIKKITAFIAWYDIWIGIFIDKKKRCVYFCPFFCVVIKVEFKN